MQQQKSFLMLRGSLVCACVWLYLSQCKVLIDQLVYGPFSNWLYFYAIGLLEGRSMSQIGLLIDRDFIRLMIANWKVWPILTFLNFRFVPLQLQVLAGNIVSNTHTHTRTPAAAAAAVLQGATR